MKGKSNMKNTKAIATIIKIARVANNYKLKELALLAQVSYTHITELEKGKKYLSDDVLERIAQISQKEWLPQAILFAYLRKS